MARGLFRKPSFWKIVGAYRSQWKRTLKRMFIPGYGKRGMGWWRNPKKAWYNWWYNRTSVRLPYTKLSKTMVLFAVATVCVWNLFAWPVDVTKEVMRNRRRQKARKSRAARTAQKQKQRAASDRSTSTEKRTSTGTQSAPRSSSASVATPRKSTGSTYTTSPKKTTPRNTTPKTTPLRTGKPKTTEQKQSPTPSVSYSYEPLPPIKHPEPTIVEPDENTPKSKPKRAGDQYIRKRMIIAGSSYCDSSVLEKLMIGSYLEVVAEPDNPHDKDAVMLTLDGNKVGYIAKSDRLAFVTCLKLKRKVYGVITDIKSESFPTKYEFETWFDQH